ncbi:MAG: recombinase family protein [Clostridia bacterium]|nr:recombinase family protein [Clostridia bacterium]
MVMKKVRCYIYTRVSTTMQVDGYSLDAQREKLQKYAEFQDMLVVGEYSDEGKSGKNINGRPEFQQMLDDIKDGKDDVSFVLVFKLSRFGRNAADVLSSLQFMQDYGVNLICVEDSIDSSRDSGKLMISVLSAVAEIERENILVQTMAGRRQKAKEGKWNGGFAPYGYYLEKGELKIAEDEAEVIRVIYDQFIHTNMGAATVAKYLNQHGYKKKTRQNGSLESFSAHFVKLVLDNPVYCGKIAYGRRKTEKINGERNQFHIVRQHEFPVYDGIHEAIISEDDWMLAQAKRKKTGVKNDKIYSLEHQHLLSGLVCCPECGRPMYGSVNRKRKKDGSFYRDYWYYACKHRLAVDGHKCSYSKQIHQDKLNAAVEEIIKKIVREPKFEEAIKAKINARIDTDEIDTEIASLQKQLRQFIGAKDRIGRSIDTLDYLDPCYDNKYVDLQKRLDDIYIEINTTEAEIAALKEKAENIRRNKISEEKVYEFLLMFDIIYDKMTDVEKKELLASFIERVDILPEPKENGQILKSITFRIPIVIDGDTGNQVSISFPTEKVTVETVALLSRRKDEPRIQVAMTCKYD